MDDIVNYFSLWLKQFFKHLHVYFEAFFKITDGYYIGSERAILDLYAGVEVAGASTPEWVLNFQQKEQAFWSFLIHISVIGSLLCNVIFTWITVDTLCYFVYRKKGKWILVLMSVILNLMVCMLSSWNGVTRYMLLVIYALLVYVCFLGRKGE